MHFSPTDALSMNATLQTAAESFSFDCLEVSFDARMHGTYAIRALVVGDVDGLALEAASSAIQAGLWTKIEVRSTRFDQAYIFQGKINKVSGTSQFANGKELIRIECVPECHELFINRRSGMYYNGSALDIIERGLSQRFSQLQYQNTKVSPQLFRDESYTPSQNSITQFNEADMAFILRNLAEYGIWANFRQDFIEGGPVQLVLGDHNTALNMQGSVEILQDSNHEGAGLYQAEFDCAVQTDRVRAIYFDESQNQYIIKERDIPTRGNNQGEMLDHHCLGNSLSDTDVTRIAESLKDSILAQEIILTAGFQGLNLQPGDVIEAPFADTSLPFVITEIHYNFVKGDEDQSLAAQFGQSHTLKALALVDASGEDISYRPAIWLKQPNGFVREYPHYHYKGVLSGCYGFPAGEIVIPDPFGNIPVQFPYNYTEVCGNLPARYTRVISLSNEGGNTGRTFPIYQDTELQVMFANGNMDFPLIKGAAATSDTGHVHNSLVQQRTHYALPQGQYTTYSNVPGDSNFITQGTTHSEGQERTFMMLSNYPNCEDPGNKKNDFIVGTSQSQECVVAGNCRILAGKGIPVMAKPWPEIPPADEDYYLFLSTVYGESASVPAAWEAVADSIVLRAAQSKKTPTPGQVVAAPLQYDAYTDPSILSKNIDKTQYAGNWQFLKAYAYLTQQKLNGQSPMTYLEAEKLQSMDTEIRPIYQLYSNKNVLLPPLISPDAPVQNETCPQQYKTQNPENPLRYYITNYYSPQGQGSAPVGFLKHIPPEVNPDDYLVMIPGVTLRQFKFYNIPHKYY